VYELENGGKKGVVDELAKDMKLLASPSTEGHKCNEGKDNKIAGKYGYEQIEKECKRLKIRNERLMKSVTDTNQKNRQYQEKLKKYYMMCQENGLIPKANTSAKSSKSGISRPETRTFGGENSVNSQK